MQSIVITDETKLLFKKDAVIGAEYSDQAYQKPNGEWVVPVSDDMFDRLQGFRCHRETIDNLVQRLIRTDRLRPQAR